MKNNFDLDGLENFLSETVEEHKMYPSDRVWRNIDNELHGGKRRWPALTFASILTGAIIISGLILIKPDKDLFTVSLPEPTNTIIVKNTTADPQQTSFVAGIQQQAENPINVPSFEGTVQPAAPFATKKASSSSATENLMAVSALPSDALATQPAINIGQTQNNGSETLGAIVQVQAEVSVPSSNTKATKASINNDIILGASGPLTLNDNILPEDEETNLLASIKEILTASDAIQPLSGNTENTGTGKQAINPSTKEKRWGIQYFVTPSISYRYLDEAKIVDLHIGQGGPIAPNLTNGVNNFVRHKPLLGMEAGAAVTYNATPNLRIKAGLQLNYRAYSIEAYASRNELSTILLNRGVYTDSITRYSSISNMGGYSSMDLTNSYWQVSVPIGFDLKVAGKKKLGLNVAASIQPTYQFSSSVYILSNDYKNYLQQPDLVRKWNVNTALEAFVSYKAGGVTWQAGPQLRYQLMPGTIKQYPIQEHLLDVGLKIGVVKTLR